MCKACLEENIKEIDNDINQIDDYLEKTTCECCRSYPSFLKSINLELKTYCYFKIRIQEQVCPNEIRNLISCEQKIKRKAKKRVLEVMNDLENQKDELSEETYLKKVDELKNLYDYFAIIDKADHRIGET
jgi:hypothetical protein